MGIFDALLSRFSEITPRDILDIFILSLLFFCAYLFVRRRRAFAAVIGVAIFVGLRFAFKALGLTAVQQVFDFFYNVGAISIVLIFQADIRAMLERVGTFFARSHKIVKRLISPKAQSNEVEAIMKAVTRLSSNRTGALMVFERSIGVEEVARKGIILDSLISTELLCNIFFSPAPLHDGAIIIRGGRIYSAACMLPSYTDPMSADFGARHRAAIGMSRSSDAFVIVVSEQTGVISCAINGDLLTKFDYGALRELLNSYYGVKVRKTKEEKKAERMEKKKAKDSGEKNRK